MNHSWGSRVAHPSSIAYSVALPTCVFQSTLRAYSSRPLRESGSEIQAGGRLRSRRSHHGELFQVIENRGDKTTLFPLLSGIGQVVIHLGSGLCQLAQMMF